MTERPKVVKGDHMVCHRTLVDLIFNALASRGEPSLSFIAIVVEDGSTELTPCTTKNELIKLAPLLGTSDNSSPVTNTSYSIEYSSTNNFSKQKENNDKTLKELVTFDVVHQPWCIQYPQLEPAQTYELKSDLIHLLPKFHGLVGKDAHKHLKEFHVVYSTMRP
ncbi:hypothetical protein CR513_30380, partial [Mucuna pruriens]